MKARTLMLISCLFIAGCGEECNFFDDELDGACVTMMRCNNDECKRKNIDDFIPGQFDIACAPAEHRYDVSGICYIDSYNCSGHEACDYIADVEKLGKEKAKQEHRLCDTKSKAGDLLCESCEINAIYCVSMH